MTGVQTCALPISTNYSQSTYFDPLMGGLGESKLSDAYPNSEPLPPERVELEKPLLYRNGAA